MKGSDQVSAEASAHTRWSDQIARWWTVPVLTPGRIWLALSVAVATDALQALFGPAGFLFVDEALDVIAMVLTTAAIGFHTLLLPTFVIEFLPLSDLLPTWTGCVLTVILLRKRAQANSAPKPPKMVQVAPPLLAENAPRGMTNEERK